MRSDLLYKQMKVTQFMMLELFCKYGKFFYFLKKCVSQIRLQYFRSYVGRNSKFDKKYLEAIFKNMNEISNIKDLTSEELINACCGAVYKALFPISSQSSSLTVPTNPSISKNIVRIITSLNYVRNYSYFSLSHF